GVSKSLDRSPPLLRRPRARFAFRKSGEQLLRCPPLLREMGVFPSRVKEFAVGRDGCGYITCNFEGDGTVEAHFMVVGRECQSLLEVLQGLDRLTDLDGQGAEAVPRLGVAGREDGRLAVGLGGRREIVQAAQDVAEVVVG